MRITKSKSESDKLQVHYDDHNEIIIKTHSDSQWLRLWEWVKLSDSVSKTKCDYHYTIEIHIYYDYHYINIIYL